MTQWQRTPQSCCHHLPTCRLSQSSSSRIHWTSGIWFWEVVLVSWCSVHPSVSAVRLIQLSSAKNMNIGNYKIFAVIALWIVHCEFALVHKEVNLSPFWSVSPSQVARWNANQFSVFNFHYLSLYIYDYLMDKRIGPKIFFRLSFFFIFLFDWIFDTWVSTHERGTNEGVKLCSLL